WITLAELLLDPQFRADTRAYLHETYATGPGLIMAEPGVQGFISSGAAGLMPKLMSAHLSGLAPDSPHTRRLVLQYVDEIATATGVTAEDELWNSMGRGFQMLAEVTQEALHDADYVASYGRYQALAATITGEVHPDAGLDDATRSDADLPDGTSLADFGKWFAASIQAARPAA